MIKFSYIEIGKFSHNRMEATATFALRSVASGISELLSRTKQQTFEFRDAEVLRSGNGKSNNRGIQRTLYRTQAMVGPPSRVKDVSRGTFVKPEWLFPTSEEGVSTSGRSAEKEVDGSNALYYLTLSTSQDDDSDISEPSAGILVSMIGANQKAFLRTLPPIDSTNPSRFQTRFLAGSKDSDVFVGTDLGRLAALWIAPERGTWRLAQARVLVLEWSTELDKIDKGSRRDLNSLLLLMSNILEKSATRQKKWKGCVYLFESNEKLLGVGDDSLAAELRPSFFQEYSDPGAMREALLGSSIKSGRIPSSYLSREEMERLRALSMKDYEALKLQFLGISSLLVGVGTAAFAALGEDRLTESFAAGGLGGFLYLVLLQRFVDQLPGPEAASRSDSTSEGKDEQSAETIPKAGLAGGAKLPVSVALVAGIALLVGRISEGGAVTTTITPQMLVAGVAGFLTSRVAVIVASLRAKSSSQDDD